MAQEPEKQEAETYDKHSNTALVIYRLDELKGNISELKTQVTTLASEVRILGGSGCFVGKENKKEIQTIKEDIVCLKNKPKEQIIFVSLVLALVLSVGGVLMYFHSTLDKVPTPVPAVKIIGP